jgi:regulator of sigma E protease
MYLLLMALVSLNLAIFNLLPIPILDGGTLLLLAIEMLLQREVSMRIKETVFKLGFVFLMMVVMFVIYNDISKILTKS